MPHAIESKRLVRTGLGLAVAMTAAAVLSGCGAGQVTQTDQMVAAVPGTNATESNGDESVTIAMRDVYIEYLHEGYKKGGSAPISARIFNSGAAGDTLTGVKTEDAESVALVSESAEESPSASASPSDSESPSGSESPSDDESASAEPGGDSAIKLEVPGGGKQLLYADGGQHLQLEGLKKDLGGGDIVTIVFSFEEVGDISMEIPVAPPEEDASREAPAHGGEHE